MKKLAVVTATLNPERAKKCFQSWEAMRTTDFMTYIVWGETPGGLEEGGREASQKAIFNTFENVVVVSHNLCGVVPAFNLGVQQAIAAGAEIIVCLHDDVLIEEYAWDEAVLSADPAYKFMGFGGATSLGSNALYNLPYSPFQLARGGFVSNMRQAEAHGNRSTAPVPCVCFDGFSQIGTSDWFGPAWQKLTDLGVRHHGYDGMLGCLARRASVYGLMLPVQCHHYGGVTAVGDTAYRAWAESLIKDGDQGFWEEAHEIWYREFRDVLPVRIP